MTVHGRSLARLAHTSFYNKTGAPCEQVGTYTIRYAGPVGNAFIASHRSDDRGYGRSVWTTAPSYDTRHIRLLPIYCPG